MSRRQMMRVSAGALLAAGLWPGRLGAAEVATRPLKFIQVNDLHYAEDACAPFFEGMVAAFNKVEGVALVLIVGDLCDTGTAGQAHAIRDILRGLKVPYYTTPGNHDYLTDTDRVGFETCFGTTFNTFWENSGWQFLGLDTSDGTKYENVSVKQPTLDYVAGVAGAGKMDKSRPTFVYTHFPLGPRVKYELVNAVKVLEPLKGMNIVGIMNGHYHGYTSRTVNDSVMVTTNVCCARKRANHDNTWQKGFFVFEVAEGKWKRTFVEYGTDFKGGVQRSGTLPNPAPKRPEDLSRPWY